VRSFTGLQNNQLRKSAVTVASATIAASTAAISPSSVSASAGAVVLESVALVVALPSSGASVGAGSGVGSGSGSSGLYFLGGAPQNLGTILYSQSSALKHVNLAVYGRAEL